MPLLRRRDFLARSSAAAAGAVVFAGCVPPQQRMEAESRVLLAEDLLSAYDNWYATTCRGCSAGCGVVVRVVDGRARKVEGNPEHPLNRGKLCVRGQALVQEQYHPDRVRGPLQRDRRGGQFTPISWQVALDQLTTRLRDLEQQGRAGDVSLITPPISAHQGLLAQRFAEAYGMKWLPFEPISETPLREAARRVFGTGQLPRFDIQNARTVLSFGGDFLGAWLSPVRFSMEYGVFRQGSYDVRAFQPRPPDRARGRLIHVDTRFSQTAAAADEWVWVRPGTEGLLALALAHALGARGLDDFAAERTSDRTAVPAERVRRIARALAENGPSLVLGGGSAGAYTNGADTLSAILQLNVLLGNVNQPGGVLAAPAPPLAALPATAQGRPLADWQDVIARMNDGREQALLFAGGANPVHGLPSAAGFREALQHVPFVASFASFLDDTTAYADLVLPSSLPLESWGDAVPSPGVEATVLSTQQPVVEALFDTRNVWDVLLALADQLGSPVRDALPWPTFKDLLQDQLRPLSGDDTDRGWMTLLQHGGAWSPPTPPAQLAPAAPAFAALPEPDFAGDAASYPFYLLPFVHNSLGGGESAHLPWLQAAPDPLTSVTWQTWVELNPSVAARLGVGEGDVVRVESQSGAFEAPVYVTPAAPPEVVAAPLGQGHTSFGRWAMGRGANPLDAIAPLADATTGALAYASTRVRLSRTGRSMALGKLEGEAPPRQLPGREVIQVLHV